MTTTDTIEIPAGFAGPPGIGHGGYVTGLFARRWPGAIQVTLRRPTPLDVPLRLVHTDDRSELWHGDELLADAQPSELVIDVPAPPTLDEAIAAETNSPATYNQGVGVHPTCFGCGLARPAGDGLRIAVGPIAGRDPLVVAGRWQPAPSMVADGVVDPHMVVAALDCAGAFAFIADQASAGLLGRITYQRYGPLADHDGAAIVTGWQIGTDGRKMLAGTALTTAGGSLVAAASAIWFPFG